MLCPKKTIGNYTSVSHENIPEFGVIIIRDEIINYVKDVLPNIQIRKIYLIFNRTFIVRVEKNSQMYITPTFPIYTIGKVKLRPAFGYENKLRNSNVDCNIFLGLFHHKICIKLSLNSPLVTRKSQEMK